MSRRLTAATRAYMRKHGVGYQVARQRIIGHASSPRASVLAPQNSLGVAYFDPTLFPVSRTVEEAISTYPEARISHGWNAEGSQAFTPIREGHFLMLRSGMATQVAIAQLCALGFQTHVVDPWGHQGEHSSVYPLSIGNVSSYSITAESIYATFEALEGEVQRRIDEIRQRRENRMGWEPSPVALVITNCSMMGSLEMSVEEKKKLRDCWVRMAALGRELRLHLFVSSPNTMETSIPATVRCNLGTISVPYPMSDMDRTKLYYPSIPEEYLRGSNIPGEGLLISHSHYGSEGEALQKFQAWEIPAGNLSPEHTREYRDFLDSIPDLYGKQSPVFNNLAGRWEFPDPPRYSSADDA